MRIEWTASRIAQRSTCPSLSRPGMIIICVNAYTSLLRAWRRAQRCSRRAHPELQSVLERGAGRRLGTTRLLQMPGDAVEVPETATRHVARATLALLTEMQPCVPVASGGRAIDRYSPPRVSVGFSSDWTEVAYIKRQTQTH